jgi:UDP-N-acetylmuramate: L-alanyl-gamma-D-glutamyl-meso-diaminopimelate ligase
MIMHVLKTLHKDFDYLVGAKLEGFSQSVNITNAPVIVCEGDEYPASVIEKKPKFHFLFPHIAILTGIAWDHINVFPTFDFYLEQFITFIHKIEKGGILIYNETDEVLKKLVEENKRSDIQYQPYAVPTNQIIDGVTTVTINNESIGLSVFGNHNLQNLHAAYWACNQLGIHAHEFLQAIQSFTGASKRLELLAKNNTTNVYRDFAHAPSKVTATVQAVKKQFPERQLVAVLELHTFSSLNEQFMKEYGGALEKADIAIVFYSNHALELKRMPPLPKNMVEQGFNKENLIVLNNKTVLETTLNQLNYYNTNLLFMSSGNYDGLDIIAYAKSKVE